MNLTSIILVWKWDSCHSFTTSFCEKLWCSGENKSLKLTFVGCLIFLESWKDFAIIIQNNFVKFVAYKEGNKAAWVISLLSTVLRQYLVFVTGLESEGLLCTTNFWGKLKSPKMEGVLNLTWLDSTFGFQKKRKKRQKFQIFIYIAFTLVDPLNFLFLYRYSFLSNHLFYQESSFW